MSKPSVSHLSYTRAGTWATLIISPSSSPNEFSRCILMLFMKSSDICCSFLKLKLRVSESRIKLVSTSSNFFFIGGPIDKKAGKGVAIVKESTIQPPLPCPQSVNQSYDAARPVIFPLSANELCFKLTSPNTK